MFKIGKSKRKKKKIQKKAKDKEPSKAKAKKKPQTDTTNDVNPINKNPTRVEAPAPTLLNPQNTDNVNPNKKRGIDSIDSHRNKRNKSSLPPKDSAGPETPEKSSSLGIVSSLCKVPSEVASVMSWAAVDYLSVQVVRTRADILLALEENKLRPSICMEDTSLIGERLQTFPLLNMIGNPKYLVSLFIKYIFPCLFNVLFIYCIKD